MVINIILFLVVAYLLIGLFSAIKWSVTYDPKINSFPNNAASFAINTLLWPLAVNFSDYQENIPVKVGMPRTEAEKIIEEKTGIKTKYSKFSPDIGKEVTVNYPYESRILEVSYYAGIPAPADQVINGVEERNEPDDQRVKSLRIY